MNKNIIKKNTIPMRMVFFILLGIMTLLFYLLIGVKFRVLLLIKSDTKSVYYTLNHRFMNLIQGKAMVLENGSVSLITKKNKLISKDTPDGYSKNILLELLSRVKLIRLDIFVDTGMTKDMFLSAMVSGGAIGVGEIVASIMRNKNIKTDVHYSNNLKRKDFALAVDLNIKATTFAVLRALIGAKKKYKKQIKEKSYA